MTRKSIAVLALLVGSSWTASSWQNDAKSVIATATKAIGAENLKSIEYSGSGYDFTLGQAANPKLPWPKFNDKTYTRLIGFEPLASRMQRVRTQGENPPRGGGLQPVIGEQQQNQLVAPGSPQAATLMDDVMMSVPQGFLRAAASAADTNVTSKTVGGKKYTVLTFTALNKAPTSGYLNNQGILERVETKIDNNVLGDIPFETTFDNYKDFGGVKFPTHIIQKQGGFPVLDLTISDVKPNAAAVFDQAKGKGGAAPAAAPTATTSEKLGDGVYLILGGYGALAVDMTDHIVVVEGPQNDQRADAVIAEAKRLIPNKPIRYVVNTHAHFDHAGGLRGFVAEGATVITHEINKPYYQKIWGTPHTLSPDKLAKAPKKPTFKTVGEKLVLTDGTHTVELYHLTNFGHHDGMLVAYLPKEKILLEADAFNPPAQVLTQTPATISPYTQSLAANLERLKLDVQRIIPVHLPADNRKVTMTELMKAIGKG
jgi:glyoxylase-like metal-dependent hydrolase (beta-lactamase superfamily II)